LRQIYTVSRHLVYTMTADPSTMKTYGISECIALQRERGRERERG